MLVQISRQDLADTITGLELRSDEYFESGGDKEFIEIAEMYERIAKLLKKQLLDIKLNPNYWDCECEESYIHSKTQKVCFECSTAQDDQPDSREIEVKYLLDKEHLMNENNIIEKQKCCNCGDNVSQGSGKFVNRIPSLDDYENKKENGCPFPEGEFICADCDDKVRHS